MVRPISAIVAKSTLRDVMNRLRRIRQTCGALDEEEQQQSSGDPFKDKIIAFTKSAKQLKEMISERNDEAQKGQMASSEIAQKSHDINVELRNLGADLRAIDALVEAAVLDVARTNKKIAKAGEAVSAERTEKLKLRERIQKEREQARETCKLVLEDLKELNQQRFLTAKEAKAMKDQGPASRRATVQNAHLRQSLSARLKNTRKKAAAGDDGVEMGEEEARGKRLEDDQETAAQMKELALKKKKEDAALDRIQAGLGRITDCAIRIGEELDQQDKMLQDAEDKADKATKDLKGINKQLTKMLKDTKPMNMMINVTCVILILGLLGFFLNEFGAF